ncbi:MAG: MucB/RseB C-terminal domain-containing protein [Brachymonas sp.]|nr:MucB/RseB C-terminal domain-containing protein [Brachymonas sp.]
MAHASFEKGTRSVGRFVTALMAGLFAWSAAHAQPAKAAGQATSSLEWLQRWQQASSNHAYAGTVTIVAQTGASYSARIWHATRNGQQIDRIEMLSGPPRTIVRSGRAVTTLFSADKRARVLHDAPQLSHLFPGIDVLQAGQLRDTASQYQASRTGRERMANYMADVVVFQPRDGWRHAYRFWSEEKTGVLLKWQMLEVAGNGLVGARVLREAGFTDVQIPAVVEFDALQALLNNRRGYAAVEHRLQRLTLQSQGWAWRKPLPGYVVTGCYQRGSRGAGHGGPGPHRGDMAGRGAGEGPPRRGRGAGRGRGNGPGAGADRGSEMGPGAGMRQRRFAGGSAVQCLVTDGLGSVSLFIEKPPQTGADKPADQVLEQGTVRMRSRWYDGTYRITAVGAVPAAALQGLLDNLHRP